MATMVRSHGFTALGPLHEALARLRGWRALAIAALLGAFCAIAFAPFHVTLALLVGLVGLVWMIDGARGQRRWGRAVFARGWAFGFGFFLISLHWTVWPFLVEPEKHAIFVWMPLVLLPGGMGLLWGAAMAMAAAFWSSSPSRVFVFVVFLAFAEWVRGWLFGGFPWNLAATSWVPGGAISQAAALGGVYWLTLLTLFVFAAPAALVDTRERSGLAMRVLPSLIAVMLVGVGWSWGSQRLAQPTEYTDRHVVFMDSGVPQAEKFEVGADAVLRRYAEMLVSFDGAENDIIIWPEGALPLTLLQNTDAMEVVTAYLGERTLIVGTARYQYAARDRRLWFNSLAVLTEDSNRSGARGLYDKHRLVPVGELPVAQILPFGEFLAGILPGAIQRLATAGFEPGEGAAIVYADTLEPFVAMICYEALYPSVPRSAQLTAGHRADWMVVVSNDAWFGAMIGPAQHYAQNRFRSIETGLPMARVASLGTSAMVDGYGREVGRAGRISGDPEGWDGRYGRVRLPAPAAEPFYQSRGGLSLFWLSLGAFSVLAFFAWRR